MKFQTPNWTRNTRNLSSLLTLHQCLLLMLFVFFSLLLGFESAVLFETAKVFERFTRIYINIVTCAQ